MKKQIREDLAVIFGGIGGVVLTLLCQYVFFPQTQSITVVVNGQEYYVTEDDYRSKLDVNEYLQSLNKELQAENIRLQQEIDELRQADSTVNSIRGTVRLRNNENINDCPQVNIPQESQIAGQTEYEMTWLPFENATTYRISVWKDADYGTADSNIILVDEVEISGLSYAIDLTALEPGYTYGYNVVVDNHFSSPLLIELY